MRKVRGSGYVTVQVSVDRSVRLVLRALDRRGRLLTLQRGSIMGAVVSGKPHVLLNGRAAGRETLRIVLRFNWATLVQRGSLYRIRLEATDDGGLNAVGVATFLRV